MTVYAWACDHDSVCVRLFAGLAHAHSLGVVHLDLKPDNVLIHVSASTGLSSAMIIDFGLASVFPNAAKRPFIVKRSARYSSPEVRVHSVVVLACCCVCHVLVACRQMLAGKDCDGTLCDLWGAAILLFYMLFGCTCVSAARSVAPRTRFNTACFPCSQAHPSFPAAIRLRTTCFAHLDSMHCLCCSSSINCQVCRLK
jgi:serine/threonine protein kinase